MGKNEALGILRRYIRNLNEDGMNIRLAFLYGSHARDEDTKESDIDVVLISDRFDTDDDVILSKPWLPQYRFDYRIEPIAVGTRRFKEDDVSPLLELIRQEGIKIRIGEYSAPH